MENTCLKPAKETEKEKFSNDRENILKGIGQTPLFTLQPDRNKKLYIYAKAEFLNLSGSIKDRVAHNIIHEAEKCGKLKKGMTIVEATSGNTGIAVATIGAIKGYPVTIIMPENMSNERKKLIRALNAKLILTPSHKNMIGAMEKLTKIKKENKNIFVVEQFSNKDNIEAHYKTTAPELWEQCNHNIDIFVSGVGSGGTIMGIGKFLKEKNPGIKIIAVEPKNMSALLGHEPGLHKIEGIGDGFVPELVDENLIDDVIEVSDEDAIRTSQKIAQEHGILAGISAGANIWGAMEIQKQGKVQINVATILPDRAERYFSTDLFL